MELILNLDWLKVIYIVGALGALTMAILIYPTIKYGPKDDEENHSRKSQKRLTGSPRSRG